MQGISVIDEAGIIKASVGFEGLKGDAALFGGFLSAIQMFIKKISGDEVRELRFGELKLVIGKVGQDHVVTLHSVSETDSEQKNRAVQNLIQDRRGPIDEGFLSLVISMLDVGAELSEKAKAEVDKLSKPEREKMSEHAKKWSKKVF